MECTFIYAYYTCSNLSNLVSVFNSNYPCLTWPLHLNTESSLGSLGSSEQLPDSDSELDESGQRTAHIHCLMKQESEVSMDDDQLSYRDSLDLSTHAAHTDPEQDADQDQDNQGVEPPALPDSGPPDDDTGAEQDLSVSLAELNVNQSNNNDYPYSPSLSLSSLPLACLSGKKLPLTRNRDSEPEYVWHQYQTECVKSVRLGRVSGIWFLCIKIQGCLKLRVILSCTSKSKFFFFYSFQLYWFILAVKPLHAYCCLMLFLSFDSTFDSSEYKFTFMSCFCFMCFSHCSNNP